MENDAKYYYNKATNYNDEGKYSLAIDNFKKALSMDPNSFEIIFNLGIAYINKKEFDLAIESFENVLKFSPDEPAAYSNMALAYSKKHDFDSAIKYYKKVLELEPEDTSAFKDLGDAFVKNRQYNEAIEYYEKFLKSHPTSFIVKESLQTAINLKNKLGSGGASEDETAVPIHTQEPDNLPRKSSEEYLNEAVAFIKDQKIDSAIEALRSCLKINPDNTKASDLLNKLFKLKQVSGNTETKPQTEKQENNTGAENQSPSEPAFIDYTKANEHFTLGLAYYNVNNYNMALDHFKKCIEINPNDFNCKKYIADVTSKLK